MAEDDRLYAIKELLFRYVRSPSLRHIRDRESVIALAQDIFRAVDRNNSVWRKWSGLREAFLKSAAGCWIPDKDLRDFLNELPGPQLTTTDVTQRLRALFEDDVRYPDDRMQETCLALYEAEKVAGTELPAIVGAIQEHIEMEQERLRVDQDSAWRKKVEEDRVALEQRFLAGADCKWTPVAKSPEVYCRVNGRTYRLTPTKDKRWDLHRIRSIDDPDPGLVGRYAYRGDATKVISKVAYEMEPRW